MDGENLMTSLLIWDYDQNFPEINLQQAVAVDQQVSRLDVPVQNPGRVQVLQT